MAKEQFSFDFEVYDSIHDLIDADAALLQQAIDATSLSYAPYSNFHVGAAARLSNGEIVKGSNQENASYPVALCAERGLLATVASLFPNTSVTEMAVSYRNENGASDHPISPCGMCRQALVEVEGRYKQPMKIILGGQEGKVFIIHSASQLLPFSFSSSDMD